MVFNMREAIRRDIGRLLKNKEELENKYTQQICQNQR